jgi:chromosome segregation ATPase
VNVQELTVTKSTLEDEKNDYQSKASKFEKLIEEKDDKLESFQKNVEDLRMNLKKKEKELSEKGSIGNKSLVAYKKKAQASLANANARAATANQAREDAEIDATNARNDADNALNAAKEAESEKIATVLKAQQEVQIFVDQIEELNEDLSATKKDLCDAEAALSVMAEEKAKTNNNREEMLEEWTNKSKLLEKEQEKVLNLEQEIAISRIKYKELNDESVILKEELENCASAAFMARQNDTDQKENDHATKNVASPEPIESDGTIVMLQQELKVANDAIRDLKEALDTALSRDLGSYETKDLLDTSGVNSSLHSRTLSSGPPTPNGNEKTDATPLFFAFEKQAELNTVRDEITRLAALLGDAESAKMEATEAMNEMRTRMEEAESRLRRYEKLAPANGSRNNGASSFPGSQSYGNRRAIVNPSLGRDNGHTMSSQNDSTVSLEYLKNIMLRYLNASTLNEKRSLVPVLGAVLELTQDEQNLAIQNVEKSAGVTGVGVSLIENIQNKGFNGLFG